MLAMRLFAVALTALVAILFLLMPGWSRPELFFTVTIEPGFRGEPEARAILGRYRAWIVAHALFGALLAAAAPAWRGVVLPTGVLWLLVGSSVALAQARRRALPYAVTPSTVREASLGAPPPSLPGGALVQLVPFFALAACALYLRAHYGEIPDRFAIHWNLDGPSGWATRTPAHVYGGLGIGAALCALFFALALGLVHATRPQSAAGAPAHAERSFRRGVIWILIGVEYFLAATFVLVGLLPLWPAAKNWILALAVTAPALALAPIILLAARRAQHAASREPGAPLGDRTPDDCWRWGLFYVNGDDPALFVEKRFGIGYTLNFANPWSWVLLSLTVILPVVSLLALR